jgi:hypothetical protein
MLARQEKIGVMPVSEARFALDANHRRLNPLH